MPLFSIGERRVELLGAHHYVAHDATPRRLITLDNEVNVWFNVVIRADNDQVTIGERPTCRTARCCTSTRATR